MNLKKEQLQELSVRLKACRRCRLAQTRQNVVPGVGSPDPCLLVLGIMPGEEEDAEGQPHVGRSGVKLRRLLNSVGASPYSGVYLDNLIRCYPPEHREPRADEIAACLPWLYETINILDPEVILGMGRLVYTTLTHDRRKIDDVRGLFLQATIPGAQTEYKIPILVANHPAFLLRRPDDSKWGKERQWIADVTKAWQLANSCHNTWRRLHEEQRQEESQLGSPDSATRRRMARSSDPLSQVD